MRQLLFLCAFVMLLPLSQVHAQKVVTHQNLLWIRYQNQIRFSPTLNWQNEIEERWFIDYGQRHHFIAHTRLHHRFSSDVDVGAGVTYSRQSAQFPNAADDLVVPEIRLVQEINYAIPVSERVRLQQRFRVDERFIRINNGSELLDGYSFNWRFRFRLQASILLSSLESTSKTTLKIFDELMVNAGSNIVYNQFDQNRVYIGVEQSLSDDISLELGYMKWYQQTAAGNRFFNRDILRFTFSQRIDVSSD
jgi:hypothetical protein